MPRHQASSTRILVTVALGLVSACSGAADDAGARDLDRATTTTTSPTTTTSQPPTTTAAPADPTALRPPAPATDPAALARQIADAEMTLREGTAGSLDLASASLAQQVAYRQLGVHPEWDVAVARALPPPLRDVAARHAAARREFRGMHVTLATTMPAWRIVSPAPEAALLAAYREAETTFHIPWQYLAAVNLVETGLGRIEGTSTAGAQGPMQFLPATWDAYGGGGDVHDPHDAIIGAARYLAANGGATDLDHALYRYNHSDRYVRGVHLYAALIAEHPRAFVAFYGWGIWYATDRGDLYLPVGYDEPAPLPVAEYLQRQ